MFNIAHIHPMLVHFPIVLWMASVLISTWLLVTRQSLSDRSALQNLNAITLLGGLAAAILAAQFGDIALDVAVDKGFSLVPMEAHEEMATVTISLFSLLAAGLIAAMWKGVKLSGIRAALFVGVLYLSLAALLVTAYRGGNLVYGLGVNVELDNTDSQCLCEVKP